MVHQLAQEVIEQATRVSGRDGGTITRLHATRYQAGTWSRARRGVRKVERSAQGVTTRLVVTDLEQARTTGLYHHISGARGEADNDIKDHTRDLQSDRTACHRCAAHQCRVLLPAAASVFLDTLRREV